jgi:large subunit ribosomal protein L11
MEFCKAYNAQTSSQEGTIIPVEISVYEDRSFDFILKTPPASVLIREALKLEKGSGEPNKKKVGKIARSKLAEIAQGKLKDMNANNVEGAVRMLEGTARSMGVEVIEG